MLTCALLVAVAAAVRGTWSPCGLSMITSINPLAERARGNRYPVTVAWFVGGAVLGGLLLAVPVVAAAWLLSLAAPSAGTLLALGMLACAVCLAADLGALRLPVHPRQVNEVWLGKYRRWIYAAGFGVQIGTGFATYIMTAATYLVAALAVLTADPAQALLVCAAFGFVRGLGILAAAGVGSAAALAAVHQALDRHAPTSVLATAAVQGAALAILAGLLAGPVAGVATALAGAAMLVTARGRVRTACAVTT